MTSARMTAPLDAHWIAAHIPHQGTMCLLAEVVNWDAQTILCRAGSHRDPANPLRADDRLGTATGIEYAAQAMAVHGALLAGNDQPPRQGYLTSVRGVGFKVARLDDLPGLLDIRAEQISGDGNNILYRFSIHHAGDCLLEGRATVILDAGTLHKEHA